MELARQKELEKKQREEQQMQQKLQQQMQQQMPGQCPVGYPWYKVLSSSRMLHDVSDLRCRSAAAGGAVVGRILFRVDETPCGPMSLC